MERLFSILNDPKADEVIIRREVELVKYITAFFMAWGNFFALPCPCKLWDDDLRRLQLIFFPMIGLIMGAVWYSLYWIVSWLGLAIQLQAAVLTIYPFLISGFIHLDGFMDCSDAILSRRELVERQRILKDSHVGAFAVISVVLLFLLFYAAMSAALGSGTISQNAHDLWALILIPVVSRACSAQAVLANKPMGHSQYVQSYNKRENKKYIVICTFMILLAIWIPIFWQTYTRYFEVYNFVDRNSYIVVVLSLVITMTASFITSLYGRKQLGGMSGDVSGYALTIAELAGVLTLAVL